MLSIALLGAFLYVAMRLLIQRVKQAKVEVGEHLVSEIGQGMLIFVGVSDDDTDEDALYLAKKAAALRIFDDQEGVMNLSVGQIGGEILSVSQFTLLADTKKGNRPSYIKAAKSDISKPLYERFSALLKELSGVPLFLGEFGADMSVSLRNDGPVTIWIDSKQRL